MLRYFSGSICAAVIAALPIQGFAQTLQDDVDRLSQTTAQAVKAAGLPPIVTIDHSRLAAAEDVEMPPSVVQTFSAESTNAAILADNIRAGLDLPYRVLSFAHEGQATRIYTGADFLRQPHGLENDAALAQMSRDLDCVTNGMAPAPVAGLEVGYGILEFASSYGVRESVKRLKSIVMAQEDTVWFAEIDL